MKIIPREVRRRKPITWSREIRALQQRLSLTQIQKEVLIGTLLGDGCLLVNVYGKNYRLYIEHSVKQKNYLEWKYEIFREWCLSQPKDKKSWRIYVLPKSVPEFRKRVEKLIFPEFMYKLSSL